MVQPFSWTIRFDVAPEWVADGFILSDLRALEMLGRELSHADMSTELAATVVAAPLPQRIVQEQGYGSKHPQVNAQIGELIATVPNSGVIPAALASAITLLDRVAFVSHEQDGTAEVVAELRNALALMVTSLSLTLSGNPVQNELDSLAPLLRRRGHLSVPPKVRITDLHFRIP